MSVPRLSPYLLRIIGVVTLVVMVSAIASAHRFGGSGQSSQRATQQAPPPPPPASQGASQPANGRGSSQGRPNPTQLSWEWWKDEAASKEMHLTPTQVRKISGVYENRVRQMKPVWEELERQRAELDKMSQERTVEVPVYAIQVNRVEALRSDLNKTRTIMFYEMHRVLTAEQMVKFREILDRRSKARGTGGPR